MTRRDIGRRDVLRVVAAATGAGLGTRLGGPWVRRADAAETAHLVHIYFPGGYNALFAGCADKFVSGGAFDVTSSNIVHLGGGVYTDAETLGTLPDVACKHWAGVGFRHGVSSHNTPQNTFGAERAILYDEAGARSYLTTLAAAMGGTSPLKAVHFGDSMPASPQPAAGGVSLQRVTDLQTAIQALGAKPAAPDPRAPERARVADGLATSLALSRGGSKRSPASGRALEASYDAAVATLRAPVPATPPVTFADVSTAYGLGGATSVKSFASMVAGAEVMIRAAGTSVVSIIDPGPLLWDFHQMDGARSLNGLYSRGKLRREVLAPLRVFCERMLSLPDRNVVVVLNGDFVRTPSGDHGDGTVATVIGKRVKNTVSFGVDGRARFAQGTPGVGAFWSTVAGALGAASPFGPSSHSILA